MGSVGREQGAPVRRRRDHGALATDMCRAGESARAVAGRQNLAASVARCCAVPPDPHVARLMRWLRSTSSAPRELDAWHAIRAGNPALDSPYFHRVFAAAVHESGRTVARRRGHRHAGGITALLPGHREGSTLRPVGGTGGPADFQGPIGAGRSRSSPLDIGLSAGVRSFEFDHLVTASGVEPWISPAGCRRTWT